MASAEKVLEEVLREVGNRLAVPPSAVDELLPLLDQAETSLSRVEQAHSQTISAALHPVMKRMAAKELLGHPDTDVKVAVASCISEITRITAPVAPYDDDLMKEFFQIIVEAFGKLDDMHDRSYSKRVSILETVAKVRSCVVMLDLECDVLIFDMFHHFLRTIRDSHPENVFPSMELIMTVVLEESEDISSHLLSCLLTSVKKDNKDISPIARRLAEKVIANCALQFKHCLMNSVRSLGASLDDYTEIVASVCQRNSDVMVSNPVNISGECVADASKLSVRTLCDELSKGSEMPESKVSCSEVVNAAVKSPKSVMSNGTVQMKNGDSLQETTLPNKKIEHPSCNIFPEHTTTSTLDTDKVDTALDQSTKEGSGHEISSGIHSAEINNDSQIDSDKDAVEWRNQHKCDSMEVDSSQAKGASDKKTEATALEACEKITEVQFPPEKSLHDNVSAPLTAPSEKLLDTGLCKGGCPPKSLLREAGINVDVPASPVGVKRSLGNENPKNEDVLSVDISLKSQNEGIDRSEPKSVFNKETKATVLEACEKRTEVQFLAENSLNDSSSVFSTAQNEKFHGKGRRCCTRGYPIKSQLKKAGVNADVPVSQAGVEGSLRNEKPKNEDVPSVNISSKKQNEGISDLEPKGLGHSVKKGHLRHVDKNGKASTDSPSKMEVEVLCDLEGKFLRSGIKRPSEREIGKIQASKNKRKKGRVSSVYRAAGEPTLKENISSPDTDSKAGKDENHLLETPKLSSQKKHAREKVIFETPGDGQKYDASLVGARIKVWWPEELQFYRGVIGSYNPVSKKHKVLYADGDEENLLLKNEVFELLQDCKKQEEGEDNSASVAAFEVSARQKESGTKSKDDVTTNDSKSNEAGKSKATQKQLRFSRYKTRQSDTNGPCVERVGSLKGKATLDINSNTGILLENEERGKKRHRKYGEKRHRKYGEKRRV